ncbi:MAG TPA: 30S ribosomal protein S2, partial [Sphaerochaeta sp.]|nr:30S ribosomal protein S2 [Sphaerochaeta sp.]
DNEVGIQIIETLGDEDEAEAAVEVKEEDEEIVFSTDEETDYSTFEAVEEKVVESAEEGEEDDTLDEETLFKD